MMDIDSAIEQSKYKENISDGGSACFDFGDVVLIKYGARENSELVMEQVNKKNAQGVNTPKHIGVKKLKEGKYEVCYVLQEKCKGINGVKIARQADTAEKVIKNLEYIAKIPFEQYIKLIYDGCMLFEMGYEAKAKNWFYDEETGFWYIDFQINDPKELNDKFDFNNPIKIFEAVENRIPQPTAMCGLPNVEWTIEEINKKRELIKIICGKRFLASKKTIPLLKKYEKFFLLQYSDDFKQYAMDNNIVDCNLFEINEEDKNIFNELCELVVDNVCNVIVNDLSKVNQNLENKIKSLEQKFLMGEITEEQRKRLKSIIIKHWFCDVIDDQKNQSNLLNLIDFCKKGLKNNNFSSNDLEEMFSQNLMKLIYKKIKLMESNYYTQLFIKMYEEKNSLIPEESFKKI